MSRYSSTWMIAEAALLLSFTFGPFRATVFQEAREEQSPADPKDCSVVELLERMPDAPWTKREDEWVLDPVAAELRRRVEFSLLSDSEWQTVLQLGDVIHTRASWPKGERMSVWLRQPPWLRSTKITLRVEEPSLGKVVADNTKPSHCLNCRFANLEEQRQLRLQPLPEGTTRLQCQVTIDQAHVGEPKLTRVWQGGYAMSVRPVDSIAEVMPASSLSIENDAVRSTLCVYLEGPDDGAASGLKLRVGGEYAKVPALKGLGISLKAELWFRERLIGTLSTLLGEGITLQTFAESAHGMSKVLSLPEGLPPPTQRNTSDWRLVITGQPEGLLCLWEANRWWSGTIKMPLSEAIENGTRQ